MEERTVLPREAVDHLEVALNNRFPKIRSGQYYLPLRSDGKVVGYGIFRSFPTKDEKSKKMVMVTVYSPEMKPKGMKLPDGLGNIK